MAVLGGGAKAHGEEEELSLGSEGSSVIMTDALC
jgi:hypothetical protein